MSSKMFRMADITYMYRFHRTIPVYLLAIDTFLSKIISTDVHKQSYV